MPKRAIPALIGLAVLAVLAGLWFLSGDHITPLNDPATCARLRASALETQDIEVVQEMRYRECPNPPWFDEDSPTPSVVPSWTTSGVHGRKEKRHPGCSPSAVGTRDWNLGCRTI